MAPTMDEIKDGTGGWNGLEVDMLGYHFHFAHTLKSAISNQQGVVGRNQSISNYRGTFGMGRDGLRSHSAQHWEGYL